MDKKRLGFLIERLLDGDISDADKAEVTEFMLNNKRHPEVTEAFAYLIEKERPAALVDTARWDDSIQRVLNADKQAKIVPVRRQWIKYAAAAAIVVAAGTYLLRPGGKSNETSQQVVEIADKAAPSSLHATLILANGDKIIIDSASTGQLAIESNVGIQLNAKGEIVYSGQQAGVSNADIQYNTFTVPRGSKIAHLYLSDGTRVLLNAGSSLKFPVVFSKAERRVEITGEAFFDVAKESDRKFVVSDGKSMIEVLGTEFNVNAYPDEANTNTTLISGAIKVGTIQESVILKPGQQCVNNDKQGDLELRDNVNIDEVTAWKNGFFYFEEASLKTIARQASRWYNVEFVFENKKAESETFHGRFSRSSTLAELLKVLEYSDVKFNIQGNVVVIR